MGDGAAEHRATLVPRQKSQPDQRRDDLLSMSPSVQICFRSSAVEDAHGDGSNGKEISRMGGAARHLLLPKERKPLKRGNAKKIVRGDRTQRGQETDRREALRSSGGVLLKGASDAAEEPAKGSREASPTLAAIVAAAGAKAGPVKWEAIRTEPQQPSWPSSKPSHRSQQRTWSSDLKTFSSTEAATTTTERTSALGENEVRKIYLTTAPTPSAADPVLEPASST